MAPHLTPTKKAKMWLLHEQGKTNREIAKSLGFDRRTIDRAILSYAAHPDPYYKVPVPGRPRVLSERDVREARILLKRGGARDGEDVRRQLFPEVGASTVRRTLAENGMRGRVRRKKPFLNKQHKAERRKWAEKFRSWTVLMWQDMWFSDESKFNLFASDGRRYCRRDVGEEYLERNVTPVVKHGGGSILLWGVITPKGVGRLQLAHGKVDSKQICAMLKNGLLGTLQDQKQEPDSILYAQDNDPKHTSRYTQNFLAENEIKLLPWPASSPDMNIIENVWDHLDQKLRHRNVLPTNKRQLWEMLQEEWYNIDPSYIQGLYESLPQRVAALHTAKGGYTHY